jgi:nucleoside-diphosphate-sugar epimerase
LVYKYCEHTGKRKLVLFMLPVLLTLVSASLSVALGGSSGGPFSNSISVLVTGATGRTGALLFKQLRYNPAVAEVRAFVRSVDKARSVLGCTKCDESEGIFEGDVNDTVALEHASKGVNTIAICVGVTPPAPAKVEEDVEFHGVENTVMALAQASNVHSFGVTALRVILCSSMGTTSTSASTGILFWQVFQSNADRTDALARRVTSCACVLAGS